jgi:amidohydrolase
VTDQRSRVIARIDRERESLIELSLALHGDPEVAYQEHRASERIAAYLAARGFEVERPYRGLQTSYRGSASGRAGGPTIAILAEYDALPDIGHACGHNLIAMIGTAAAIGASEVLGDLAGRIAAIGTPAEEGGGGKVALVRAGGFAGVDAAMMVHPSSRTLSGRTSLASNRVELEFHGKAAHAAAQPDRGINALDGLIQTFNAVNAMRQQLKPDARVHGIITSGGSAANIIPAYAAGKFSVRARDHTYQKEVLRRFIACAEGAAAATGTRLVVTVNENSGYENMVPSTPLAERWAEHVRSFGIEVTPTADDERMGSTDMGNVSQIVPAAHPYIGIAPEGTPGHSTAFRDAAATPEAHANAIAAAKALALLAVDLMQEPALLARAKAEFDERRRAGVVKGS